MKPIVIDSILNKISQIDNKVDLLKYIIQMIKEKQPMDYIRTALNKLYLLPRGHVEKTLENKQTFNIRYTRNFGNRTFP